MTSCCPTCTSPAPHLHPAVQHEGEVSVCRDPFHQQVTPENTPERISQVAPRPDGLLPGRVYLTRRGLNALGLSDEE